MKKELIRKLNKEIVNEKVNQPFVYEYFGEEIDFLNLLLEREELTSENCLYVGKRIFDCRKDMTSKRKNGSVQLGFHQGFGGGNTYIIIPSEKDIKKGKNIRVFADHAQPERAITHMCDSFIKAFETIHPFKKEELEEITYD